MDNNSMAALLQMLMANGGNTGNNDSQNADATAETATESDSDSENAANPESAESENFTQNMDFGKMFENIDFSMLSKFGELFSLMNKTDRNAELLLALKPHLREENRHKVDTALKISRMFSLIPHLKDSGILNNLF